MARDRPSSERVYSHRTWKFVTTSLYRKLKSQHLYAQRERIFNAYTLFERWPLTIYTKEIRKRQKLNWRNYSSDFIGQRCGSATRRELRSSDKVKLLHPFFVGFCLILFTIISYVCVMIFYGILCARSIRKIRCAIDL